MSREDKLRQIEELRASVRRLETELAESTVSEEAQPAQQPPPYYAAYHILAGFSLGMFGAATSLLFNVVGSLLVGHHPLHLIQVYLTFPLGESALNMDGGVALAIGCCLYLGDRKSTRLNSSHTVISYAVFCLKKKKNNGTIF